MTDLTVNIAVGWLQFGLEGSTTRAAVALGSGLGCCLRVSLRSVGSSYA